MSPKLADVLGVVFKKLLQGQQPKRSAKIANTFKPVIGVMGNTEMICDQLALLNNTHIADFAIHDGDKIFNELIRCVHTKYLALIFLVITSNMTI